MSDFKVTELDETVDFGNLPYWDVVIIGAGPAGLAGSLTTAHRGLTTLVIEAKEQAGGQPQFLYADKRIVDIPGFPDGITGEELSSRVYRQATNALVQFRFNEELKDIEDTEQVEKEDALKRVITSGGTYLARKVIIACGLLHYPRKLPILDALDTKKVHYKIPKIGDYESQLVAVVGGGDSALDAAVMVLERHGRVELLVREESPVGKADTLHRIRASGGHVRTSTSIQGAGFQSDKIELTLSDRSSIAADLVIAQIGFLSAKETFERLRIRLNADGSVAVDPYFETSRRGIFAVGDVHGDIKLIAVAWAEGIQAAIYAFKEITSPYWLNERRLRDQKIAMIGEKMTQAAGSLQSVPRGRPLGRRFMSSPAIANAQEFAPTTQSELCRYLAENSEGLKRGMMPVGGRTSLEYGEPLDKPHALLVTTGLSRVIDFPARDMTVTVEAGIRVDRLADALREQGLQLPIDIPQSQRATLGGALACNVCGPRRFGHGTFRDYVLGLSAATADGRLFHSGGRVVKNVAGYDLCKLLVGSLGTLAVVAQVTLKLKPIPQARAIVGVAMPNSADLEVVLEQLTVSSTRPVALEIVNPSAAASVEAEARAGLPTGCWLLLALFEGSERQVQWECDQFQTEVIGGKGRTAFLIGDPTASRLLLALIEFAVPADEPLAFQASLAPSRLVPFLDLASSQQIAIVAGGASGIVVGKLPDEVADAGVASRLIGPLRMQASEAHGGLTILHCNPQWKPTLSVFGEMNSQPAMRRLKQASIRNAC